MNYPGDKTKSHDTRVDANREAITPKSTTKDSPVKSVLLINFIIFSILALIAMPQLANMLSMRELLGFGLITLLPTLFTYVVLTPTVIVSLPLSMVFGLKYVVNASAPRLIKIGVCVLMAVIIGIAIRCTYQSLTAVPLYS